MVKTQIFKLLMLSAIIFSTLVGCTKDDELGVQDDNYGYIQFKLYKESSYVASKATVSELEYLSDAKRMQVTLLYNGTTITQTVDLSAYDDLSAEYGLRSEKLYLLSGDYSVESYNLYDIRDNVLYNSTMEPISITVPVGGMEVCDLTAKAVERGKARFTFVKDFVESRSSDDMSRFITSRYVKLSLVETSIAEQVVFDSIPVSAYSVYDDNNRQSIVLKSDSLFVIKAGEWRVTNYSFYSSLNALLATGTPDAESVTLFEVQDNVVATPQVKVSMSEDADYINDYKALYAIWQALDGENWSYYGQSFPNGANWNFNKEVDLWGYQPGVMLHDNGRVASLNLSEFGIRGDMPAEIGQLSQLVELFLGTHNDTNGDVFSSQLQGMSLNGTLAASRMAMGKAYIESRLGGNQIEKIISPLLRKAYLDQGKEIPGGASVTQEEIDMQISGQTINKSPIQRADVAQGVYCNGLTSLPEEFGNLVNLQTLFIANGMLTTLPESMSLLENLTDVELYNCQDMKEFPMALTTLPNLVSLNISENIQWSAEEIYKGLDALFSGASQNTLQLLYGNNNLLEELPESLGEVETLGLLMMTNNKISKVHAMPNIRPVQFFLDYNLIEEIPDGFCDTEDAESISFSNNLIKVFPNIFNKDDIPISSVSFADNMIDSVAGAEDGTFAGISVLALNLSGNNFTMYPSIFATSGSYINQMVMSNNELVGFEENSFVGEHAWYTESLDLSNNRLTSITDEIYGTNLPYLYGLDLSYNRLDAVPFGPLNSAYLTIYIIRGQRDASGNRTLKTWPDGIGNHSGMRGLFLGSNDLRTINDDLSFLIYNLDIADNPNIVLDASGICPYITAGMYALYYDKTQDIRNCAILGTNQ
ncbi:MAG: DUF4458 domain-containing protein [Rikenellaceae bacterium]